METKKDAYHFRHDSNAQHDERILELRAEYGWEGYGLYWALIEKMRDAQDYRLNMGTLGGLCAGLGVLKPLLSGLIELALTHGLFALEQDGAHFYSPSLRRRLQAWDAKKAAFSDAGKRGAEARQAKKEAAESKPPLSQVEATLKPPLSQVQANRIDKNRIEQSYDVAPSPSKPEILKASNPGQALAVATTDPADEQHWSAGPLTKPHPFRVICERLGFLELDFEHYRKQALVAAEDADISRTIAQWTSWIRNYLNHQSKHGPLLKAAVVDLSQPTPRHLMPREGSDCTGIHIVLANTGDANLNRIAAQSKAAHYPNITIHHVR